MGKGYQRKIDSIIDKMVEGNIEFNRKSTKQQDIDKVEISNNINNVIAILNDEGVKLVLNELDSIASQKSSEIFDSKGNINTSEVVKFTTNIVKSTIETAQRDGIDLTQNTTVKKNETIMETVFTVAMINDMIKNYDNLTLEEKDKLLGQYDNLSREQQIVIKNNIIKESQRVEEMLSESEQEKYKNDIEKNEAKKKS